MQLPIDYDNTHWSVRKQAREQYVKEQDSKCCHCGESLKELPSEEILSKQINVSLFPDGFFSSPVHLHHCHNTGITIDAVHNKCNAVLWQYHGE
jgi:hypothetical protein